MAEETLKIRVDADTQKVQAFNNELDRMPKSAGEASVKVQGLTGSIIKSQIALEGIKFAVGKAVDAFKDGLKEMAETEAAMRRIEAVAKSTGQSVQALSNIAKNISADGLISMSTAMQGVADLAQKGFAVDQIKQMALALEDIAASAGGNTAENFQKLVDAMVTGKTASAEMNRFLPALKDNLQGVADKADPAQKNMAIFKTVMEQWNVVGDASTEKLKAVDGQIEALTNSTNTLKEAWAKGLTEGFKGATDAMGGTAQTMSELEGVVETLGKGISITLVTAFKLLKGAVELALTPFRNFIEALVSAPGIIREFDTMWQNFVNGAERFGRGLVDAIQKGITQRWEALKSYFSGKLQEIRDMLTSSDAKVGPWKDITGAGAAFWSTLVVGMQKTEGLVKKHVTEVLQEITGVLAVAAAGAAKAGVLGTDKWRESTDKLIDKVRELSDLFFQLGSSVGGRLGTAFNVVGGALEGLAAATEKGIKGFEKWAAVAIAAAQQVGGAVSRVANYAALGASIGGGYGALIGAGIGIIVELLDKTGDAAREAQTMVQGLGFSISVELSEAIAQSQREIGTWAGAIAIHLGDIAAEIGVTERNFLSFIRAFSDGLNQFQVGSVRMEQVLEGLNSSFDDMVVAATDGFGFINQELLDLIASTQLLGVEVEAITNFLNRTLITVSENFQALLAASFKKGASVISGGGAVDIFTGGRDAFGEFQSQFLDIFAKLAQQGFSTNEIIAQLGDSMGLLRQAAKQLGLDLNPAIRGLFQVQSLMKKFPEATRAFENIRNMVVGFQNLGMLSQRQLGIFENQMLRTFDEMNKDGRISRAELQLIAPLLQSLLAASEKMGLELGSKTQQLIDEAKKKGIIVEPPQDPSAQWLPKIYEVLERIRASVSKEAPGVIFDSGPSMMITRPTFAQLNVGDRITPPSGSQMTAAQRSVAVPINEQPTIHVVTYNTVYLGDTKLDTYITERFEKGNIAPASQMTRLRGRG